ncbi:zinc finger protein 541-like [Manis pentadactyla]|uniref:zinc finger protein 541-like n=1 Tax=Manis pentadactyla TaxID=143292 RepID=UPI00255CFEC2|nr:zinc finger protein 541-like [Manis pentadactyla]
MDQNSAGEEGALPSEIHLSSFSESQGLNCINALNQDLGPSSRDLLYAGLSRLDMDPSLPAPNVPSKVLEDNLDAFSLYSGEDRDSVKLLEKYADPASQASLQDLRLGKLPVPKEADEGGRATSRSAGKEEQHHTWPQKLLLDCSVCGKVFSSTSSRSKHYLTHSQERKHICGICSKAFKRKDHLTRHMLTHQKTKPFACREQGCSKSYCDDRSLRQHYEVQHGLCVLKEAPPEEEACGDSSPAHEGAGQPAADGLRSLMPPEARSSGPLLPNREPLRSIVSSMVHQEISSLGPVLAGPSDDGEGKNTACPSPPSLGPYTCTPAAPGTLGTDVPEECHPLWKEPATGFTAIHSRVAEDGGPHPAELERPPQQLPTLESWQEAGPSVDPPQDSKPKLTISNRIQDGNTYRLPDPVKEESMAAGRCDKWLSPQRKQDQQVKVRVQDKTDSEESSQPRKRRKCLRPKASFLPPAPYAFGEPGPEGGHQSCLWFPVLLVDHSLQGLFQWSPSMLPLDDSDKVIGSKLDQVDDCFGICAIENDTKPSIRPHIRIGSEFQAEIPELQERPTAETGEYGASLGAVRETGTRSPSVCFWGRLLPAFTDSLCLPFLILFWGHLLGTVTELCKMASSAMPGGGTNLELALHCLHEAQGDVPVALETLLHGGPQKPLTHPLANYHYAGSDVWTSQEKILFNKAFQAHKKNFHLIHKMVRCMWVGWCRQGLDSHH